MKNIEIYETVGTFNAQGPTADAREHANKFVFLRKEYTAWISPDIERELELFEKAVRKVGISYRLAQDLSGQARDEVRLEALDRSYEAFHKILNPQTDDGGDADDSGEVVRVSAIEVISLVREILELDKLTAIRQHLIEKAYEASKRK